MFLCQYYERDIYRLWFGWSVIFDIYFDISSITMKSQGILRSVLPNKLIFLIVSMLTEWLHYIMCLYLTGMMRITAQEHVPRFPPIS